MPVNHYIIYIYIYIWYMRGGREEDEIYGYYYIILYYIECDIMSIYYEQCGYIHGIKWISKIEKMLHYTYIYI